MLSFPWGGRRRRKRRWRPQVRFHRGSIPATIGHIQALNDPRAVQTDLHRTGVGVCFARTAHAWAKRTPNSCENGKRKKNYPPVNTDQYRPSR